MDFLRNMFDTGDREVTPYDRKEGRDIESGLSAEGPEFKLNGKPIQILSGSLHYFRVMRERWAETIAKMKHCGLNTVCTYVPWNLHEDKPGTFNFSGMLDLRAFVETVAKEGMYLLLRPGPYVCAELDFGGLPSWLLSDKNMKVRSNYPGFKEAVKRYFTKVINLVSAYQFSVSGGPIIAVQVENEFASYGNTQENPDDYQYMAFLRDLLRDLGIKELLYTCDMPSKGFLRGSIGGVLMTANCQDCVEMELDILRSVQPGKPLMVAEFWSGWFDHWGERHQEITTETYSDSLMAILKGNASVNIYVFHGGTNFGFTNGANMDFPNPGSPYTSTVTSYDYGALLTESGELTKKYFATDMLKALGKDSFRRSGNKATVKLLHTMKPLKILVTKFLPLSKMLPLLEKCNFPDPVPMEMLNPSKKCGQRFGFTIYQTKFDRSGTLKFNLTRGTRIVIVVNDKIIDVIEAMSNSQECRVDLTHYSVQASTLYLVAENLGRISFTENPEVLNNERRGIFGAVTLEDNELKDWSISPLDFNEGFMKKLDKVRWELQANTNTKGRIRMRNTYEDNSNNIGIYGASVTLEEPRDTFLYSKTWKKGIAFVNGFNLGRYWIRGPQQTLYLPAELLKKGTNELSVFELHNRVTKLEFAPSHVLDVLDFL